MRTAAGTARAVTLGVFLVAVVLAPSGAHPLDDVLGWRNTQWGMTPSEVKGSIQSLRLPVTPLPPPCGRALGTDAPFKTTVEIAGNHYDAMFLFSADTHRLDRVLVRTLDFSREHALALHGRLLRWLTEEYGRTGEPESRGNRASLTRWTFRTTTVILSMQTDTTVPGNPVTQVAIMYAPTATGSEEAKDKLLGLGLLRALGESGHGQR